MGPLRHEVMLLLLLLLLQELTCFPGRVAVEEEVPQGFHPTNTLAAEFGSSKLFDVVGPFRLL